MSDFNEYPSIENKNFYDKLYQKAEIWQHFIKDTQSTNQLTQPQLFLRDFMNPFTPYIGLLIIADVGAGKTCGAVQIAQQFKGGKKIIILTRASLVQQFKRELVLTCTNDYISDEEKTAYQNTIDINDRKKMLRAFLKRIRKFYIIMSFDTFFNKKRNINNTLIIIDEIHNFREESQRLLKLQKLLDKSINTKRLLISATPMIDDVFEIIDIFKIFGVKIPKKYVNMPYKYKKHLIEIFRGYVSYFAADVSKIPIRHDNGTPIDGVTKYTKLVMVDNNQKYNKLKNIIKKQKTTTIKSINILRNYTASIKIKQLVQDIQNKYPEGRGPSGRDVSINGPVVVFSEFVQDLGGVFNISRELTNNGISNAVMSGSASLSQRQDVLYKFNHPDNKNGALLKALVMTRTGSEGLNLKNVSQVFICTPLWNIASMEQIIGRAIRLYSHTSLPREHQRVDVFLYCVRNSIDEKIYNMAEKKDIKIQHMINVMRQSAIDCILFQNLNKQILLNSEDYSRQCFYDKCVKGIKCHQKLRFDRYGTDISTIQTSHEQRQKYEHAIIQSFKNNQGIQTIQDVVKNIQHLSTNVIIIYDVLDTMVMNNVLEKHGMMYYLKSHKNTRLIDLLILRDPSDINPQKDVIQLSDIMQQPESQQQQQQQQQQQHMSQTDIRNIIRQKNITFPIAGFMIQNQLRIIDRREAEGRGPSYYEAEGRGPSGREAEGDIRKIPTGQVCSTIQKDKIIDMLRFMQVRIDKTTKDDLCSLLHAELIRRHWMI